jgi:hypothetical protein
MLISGGNWGYLGKVQSVGKIKYLVLISNIRLKCAFCTEKKTAKIVIVLFIVTLC